MPSDSDDQHARGATESEAQAALWDERYRSSPVVWSGNPNPQLVAEVADLPPGRALEIGGGEGADAVWLAERGWRVTAVDISAVALERAAAAARDRGHDVAARIEWVRADANEWEPGALVFDLVTAQFVHLPEAQRVALHRRLARAVAPGGTLLVVGHHPSDLDNHEIRRPPREVLFTAADVTAVLDGDQWIVAVDDARSRETTNPDGAVIVVHDTVVNVRRAASA